MAKTRTAKTPQPSASKPRRMRSVKGAVAVHPRAAATTIREKAIDAPAQLTKKDRILTLLQRAEGATIDDLISATGWQAHSVRAVLTGFRKEGKELGRSKDEAGMTRYQISAEA